MLERFLLVRHDAYTFMFLNPTILSFTPLKVFLVLEGFDVFNTVSARALRTAVTESFSEVTLEGFELFHC